MLLSIFILIRIFSNPLSNMFQKKLVSLEDNSLLIILIVFALLSVVSFPFATLIFSLNLPVEYFLYMFLCAIFAVSSNTLLVKALSYSDLSLLGPINSYKPIVGMISSIFLLGEIPSFLGLTGIVLILSGSYFIVDRNPATNNRRILDAFVKDKGIQLRFTALILSGVEAAFLKKSLTYSTPIITMIVWSLLGFIISGIASLFIVDFQNQNIFVKVWDKKKLYFLLFISTAVMQLTTLLIFENMQVGYALALFQISSLISVILGYKYFKEKNIRNRIIGSLLMIGGSVIIILFNT